MLKANIYGLPPNKINKTIVEVYDDSSYSTPKAKKLFEGAPDGDGKLMFKLPKEYRNKKVRLLVIADQFEEIGESLDVNSLGLFHTVNLERSTELSPQTETLPINLTAWRLKSQEMMRKDYRGERYKNYLFRILGAIATISAAFIGWLYAGIWGLVAGCILTVLVIIFGNYISGQSEGI